MVTMGDISTATIMLVRLGAAARFIYCLESKCKLFIFQMECSTLSPAQGGAANRRCLNCSMHIYSKPASGRIRDILGKMSSILNSFAADTVCLWANPAPQR